MTFGVKYKDKEFKIKCDKNMAGYSPDEDGECTTDIMKCRDCVIDCIKRKTNNGWDNEENQEYELSIRIGDAHIGNLQ